MMEDENHDQHVDDDKDLKEPPHKKQKRRSRYSSRRKTKKC